MQRRLNGCKLCGSRKKCEAMGREKFWARLGRCTNCKAMMELGTEDQIEINRGKKAHVECPEEWQKGAPSITIQIWLRARCPICGAFPARVEHWHEPKLQG